MRLPLDKPSNRFADKNVVVTGGASGIGAASSIRLATEGAHVIVGDKDESAGEGVVAQIVDKGGRATFLSVDLSDSDSIRAFGNNICQQYELVDGLINNAGIVQQRATEVLDFEDWDLQLSINLKGPVTCARHLMPSLKRAKGSIVNISSEGGFCARKNHCVYDATKAGLDSATRTLASELIEFDVRVNSIAPGPIVTEMQYRNHENPQKRRTELLQAVFEKNIAKRWGRPEEIASVAAFLLTGDASYITGTVVHVDGGKVAT